MYNDKMEYRPKFFITPYELIEDDRLKPSDIKVYGTIYYFEKMKYGKCIAGNRRIAEFANLEVGSVRNSLSRLNLLGYVKTYYEDDQKKIRNRIECQIEITKSDLKDNWVD